MALTFKCDCFLLHSLRLHFPFSGPFHFGSYSLINTGFHSLHNFQVISLSLKSLLFLPRGVVFYFLLLYLISSHLLQSLRSTNQLFLCVVPAHLGMDKAV